MSRGLRGGYGPLYIQARRAYNERMMAAGTSRGIGALPLPLQFMAAWLALWLGEHQVIAYQRAENVALLERLGKRQLRLYGLAGGCATGRGCGFRRRACAGDLT